MNPRFTQGARAAMAAVLLSMSPAQSGSKPAVARNCDNLPTGNSGVGRTTNPSIDSDRSAYVLSNRSGGNSARSSATGQQPTCQGDICTYPCPNGDGYCTYRCPSRGTQDGPSTDQPPSRGEFPPYRGDDGHGGGGGGIFTWIFGGVVAVAGAAVVADQLTGKDWVNSTELDAHGPRFPIEQKVGRFQVQGYSASNWPFLLDIYSQPGTRTWLEVRFKGDKHSQSVDLTRPEGGRRVAFVQLPPASGGVRVARYSIHSVLERQGQEPLYMPIIIYGIGAGPGAVGAIQSARTFRGIDGAGERLASRSTFAAPGLAFLQASSAAPAQLSAWLAVSGMAAAVQPGQRFGSYLEVTAFGPQYPSRPADVSWVVAARQSFQRSELEVLQVPRDGEGKLVEVLKSDLDLFARPQASGSWGGVPVLANVRPGTYQLQARAWRPRAGGGDWTGAFAPTYVYIR